MEVSVLGNKELVCEFLIRGGESTFKSEVILDDASDTVSFILLTKSFSVADVTEEAQCFKEIETLGVSAESSSL